MVIHYVSRNKIENKLYSAACMRTTTDKNQSSDISKVTCKTCLKAYNADHNRELTETELNEFNALIDNFNDKLKNKGA